MWLIMDKISNKICSILNLRRVNVKLGKYVWYGWRVEILCWEKVCKLHWDLFQECLEKYFQCQEQTIIVFPIRGVFLRLKDFANRHHSPINVKKFLKFIWFQEKSYLHTSSECFIFLDVVGEATELSLEVVVENSSVEKLIDSTWYPNCFIRHLKKNSK